MAQIIKDGTGSGDTAKVDNNNRLTTFGTNQTTAISAMKNESRFITATSVINLTTANESTIFYLKTNENSDLLFCEFRLSIGPSVDACCALILGDVATLTVYVNPTGGTLICNAVIAITANKNVGAQKTVCVTAFQGVEGDTLTGQLLKVEELHQVGINHVDNSPFMLQKGGIIAFGIIPPAGNAGMKVTTSSTFYIIDQE